MGVGVNCQGNAVNAGEYRGMPGERIEVGAKRQGNAGECRGMPGERLGVGANCQGNAGECRGMPGEHGSGCIAPRECRELPGECKVAGVKF